MPLLPVAAAAQELLALLGTIATANTVELPERQYVAAGATGTEAWDCEQVTVALGILDPAQSYRIGQDEQLTVPADRGLPSLSTAVLGISIVRCHPVLDDQGNPPTAVALAAAEELALTDAALLRLLAIEATRQGNLTHCAAVRGGAVTPSGPDGGYVAMTLGLAVTVV